MQSCDALKDHMYSHGIAMVLSLSAQMRRNWLPSVHAQRLAAERGTCRVRFLAAAAWLRSLFMRWYSGSKELCRTGRFQALFCVLSHGRLPH